MKHQHTALLPLPDLLRGYGLNVVAMEGWDTAQGSYLWRRPDGTSTYATPPSGIIFHGTAGTVSRPVVRTRLGRWSVAGAWVGLDNGNGTLTSQPVVGSINRPTIYLTSAGPARYSAGRGDQDVLDMMYQDIRPPGDATKNSFPWRYANRYTFNVENTHPNDGSPIDADVFDTLVGLGVVLHNLSQEWDDPWTERTLGHRTFTPRKPVDPWFTPGGIVGLQDQIQIELGGDMWANDITDQTWMTMFHSSVPDVAGYGRYYCSDDGTVDWSTETFEGLGAAWGTNPHAPTDDGDAKYSEKVNALNYLFAGFAQAAGQGENT